MSFRSLKQRAEAIARSLVPPHRRLARAGESLLADGGCDVRELPRLVAPNTTAVDVGARVGGYTYALSRHVGPRGRILAIESIPALADTLARAVRGLRLPVTVVNCALGVAPGQATLAVPAAEDGWLEPNAHGAGVALLERRATLNALATLGRPADATARVPVRTLDDVCAGVDGRISFIKVAVRGRELDVFRGGVRTLARHRPNLLVEIEQRHASHPIAETFDFLTAENYHIEFLDPAGHRRPLVAFDPALNEMLVDSEGTPLPGYVSCFIFTPLR